MADRTLYDLLEISRGASQDTIQAAYERTSKRLETDESMAIPGASLQRAAVKDAYLTLSNPARRAAYEKRLDTQWTPEAAFWSLPKIAFVAVLALLAAGLYYRHSVEQSRLAAEKEIAIAEAKAAEEQARAEAEAEQFRQAVARVQAQAIDAIQHRENEIAMRRFAAERAVQERNARFSDERERLATKRNERDRQREELQAHRSAHQQLVRERAILCQMERERYGQAISCP
jgi:curved DNA-binding protein CbpA